MPCAQATSSSTLRASRCMPPSDVRQALKEASSAGKHTVLMRIKSGDSTHFVAMPVAAG
jgi:hypothetical protein